MILKGAQTGVEVLEMILNGSDPAWRSNPLRYVSLHAGDPGAHGFQDTNEVEYDGYTRQRMLTGVWDREGYYLVLRDSMEFPVCWEEIDIKVSHISIGESLEGPGQLFYVGELTSPLTIHENSKISFPAGDLKLMEV